LDPAQHPGAAEIALAVVCWSAPDSCGEAGPCVHGERIEPRTLLTMAAGHHRHKYQPTVPGAGLLSRGGGPDSRDTGRAIRRGGHRIALLRPLHGRSFTIEGRPFDPATCPLNVPGGSPSISDTAVPLRAASAQRERRRDALKVALISEGMASAGGATVAARQRIQLGRRIPRTLADISSHSPATCVQPLRPASAPVDLRFLPAGPALWMDIGSHGRRSIARGPAVTAAIRSVDREQPITNMQDHARHS